MSWRLPHKVLEKNVVRILSGCCFEKSGLEETPEFISMKLSGVFKKRRPTLHFIASQFVSDLEILRLEAFEV
ncbi:hypothetical protein PanWU01x14_181420 [Parasponia andersonii]|uniref:Uncharacterized protein n=1 Tax=Parasponia andersonii TaxID=3476 RepID=A0A2P5C5Y8_PARAD|nr:hypothetical protein PanWU01x14_181420 [Parasponia andersonii]